MKEMLLISNMYPSKEDIFYGIFVKNFEKNMGNYFVVKRVVIKGKEKNKIQKILKYVKFFKEVYIEVKKGNYNFIYVHYIGHSLIPFIFLKKNLKKPLIINAHGSDVLTNSRIGKFIQKLVIPVIKRANMVVVPSEYFKDIVHNIFMIEKEKIFISPSGGIDTKLFKPKFFNKDIFTIGYVSRIDKGKGWDVLLEAVNLLKEKNYKFRVLIIGSGVEEKLFLQKIRELKLENIVEYVGAKPHNKLVDYFNQMNVFAFTTRLAESLGLVGLEAMACGVPVIGSNIGGLKTYIKPGFNGELFEVGNIKNLYEKLKFFLEMDKEKYEMYSKNAITTAKEYSSEKVVIDLIQKIKEII